MSIEFEQIARLLWFDNEPMIGYVAGMDAADRTKVSETLYRLYGIRVLLTGGVEEIRASLLKAKGLEQD
jgi:hypothetical protein